MENADVQLGGGNPGCGDLITSTSRSMKKTALRR
jgi:hypothetical protein